MKANKNKIPLIIACIAAVFCFLSFYIYEVREFFHTLVNIFAGGRSSVKAMLFFLYLILLCLAAYLNSGKETKFRIKNSWLWTAIGAVFAYQIMILAVYLNKFKFGINEFVITFNNNEISSTSLAHNHILKPINGFILNLFTSPVQEKVDAGWAFVGLMPNALFLIGAVLVLIAIFFLLTKFNEIYSSSEKWKGLLIVTYAIISFSIIKNMLDGGILNRETLIAISGLLSILYYNSKRTSLFLIPIGAYVLSISVFMLIAPDLLSGLWFNLYLSCTFAAIIFTLLYWYFSNKPGQLRYLLVILCLAFIYPLFANSINNEVNINKKITEDGAYIGMYAAPKTDPESALMERIGNLSLYYFKGDQKSTAKQIMVNNNLLNNIDPIAVPWINCIPTSPTKQISFTLTTFGELKQEAQQHRFAYISYQKQTSNSGEIYEYEITVNYNPCTPRLINVVEELIKSQGQNTFFITNPHDSSRIF